MFFYICLRYEEDLNFSHTLTGDNSKNQTFQSDHNLKFSYIDLVMLSDDEIDDKKVGTNMKKG